MKIGELLKIARAVIEDVVEIPDLEAVTHPDEQDVASRTAPLVEPPRDLQPSLAVNAR